MESLKFKIPGVVIQRQKEKLRQLSKITVRNRGWSVIKPKFNVQTCSFHKPFLDQQVYSFNQTNLFISIY